MASEIERNDPPLVSDERTSLAGWLDFHRATLLQKCEGLSGQQLVQPSVPPSDLTLLGLVQHMHLVDWWWIEHVFAGESTPPAYESPDDPDIEFHDLDPAQAEEALTAFAVQCERSRSIVERAKSLDELSASPDRETRNLRWVMTHLIEEYARHNGHADLLRECVDGVVGD